MLHRADPYRGRGESVSDLPAPLINARNWGGFVSIFPTLAYARTPQRRSDQESNDLTHLTPEQLTFGGNPTREERGQIVCN